MDTFGSRLRVAIKSANRTQDWLADQVGRSKGAVSQWVNNTGEPDIQTLAKICELLDVTADYLILGEGVPGMTRLAARLARITPEARRELAGLFADQPGGDDSPKPTRPRPKAPARARLKANAG